jgi:hypothetical protein
VLKWLNSSVQAKLKVKLRGQFNFNSSLAKLINVKSPAGKVKSAALVPPWHTRDRVHLIVCIVQERNAGTETSTVPGIGAVRALRVAGTKSLVELYRSFAIAPVVT